MMSRDGYFALMSLLPRLSAKTDKSRLNTLAEIGAILKDEGITWRDVASLMSDQGSELDPLEVLAYLDVIENSGMMKSVRAGLFLHQLRMKAETGKPVKLTPRQDDWLMGLLALAESHMGETKLKPHPLRVIEGGSPNLARGYLG
jgi:hypothetical protein